MVAVSDNVRETLYRLYPHQLQALALASAFRIPGAPFHYPHPIVALSGGVRNGKTRALACWILMVCGYTPYLAPPPPHIVRRIWIVVPTRDPFWNNIKPEIEGILGWANEGGVILDQNKSEPSYILRAPDGGAPFELVIRTAEDPDRLRGATIYAAAVTEAGKIPDAQAFKILRGRVLASKGYMFLESSPFGKNWFYTDVVERAHLTFDYGKCDYSGEDPGDPIVTVNDEMRNGYRMKDPRIAAIRGVPIQANRSLDEEWIDDYAGGLSDEERRRELAGEFFQWSGLIWRAFDSRIHMIDAPQPEDFTDKGKFGDGWRFFAGMDFGFDHPFAHVWIARKREKRIVVDEHRAGGLTLDQHAEIIKSSPWNRFIQYRFRDPSGAQAAADLAGFKVYSEDGENQVEPGLDCVARLFQREELLISRRCRYLPAEIQNYHRHEKTGKPVKKDDDLCDALRYGIYSDDKHGGPGLPHASIDPQTGQLVLQADDEERVAEYRDEFGDVDDSYNKPGKEIV